LFLGIELKVIIAYLYLSDFEESTRIKEVGGVRCPADASVASEAEAETKTLKLFECFEFCFKFFNFVPFTVLIYRDFLEIAGWVDIPSQFYHKRSLPS
jgi:hypothetical protein